MQIVIDIDDKVYGLLKYFENGLGLNDKKDDNDDVKTALMRAVLNGTPLPKGHGRLIDADAFERRCMFDSNIEDMQDVIYALRDYKPIIEADKEREVEVLTRCNCMMCGKELEDGLFFARNVKQR